MNVYQSTNNYVDLSHFHYVGVIKFKGKMALECLNEINHIIIEDEELVAMFQGEKQLSLIEKLNNETVLVFNENTKALTEALSISLNNNSIQINI